MPPVGQTVMGGAGASDPLFTAPSQEVINASKDKAITDELGRLRAEASKVASRSQEENRLWTAISRRVSDLKFMRKHTFHCLSAEYVLPLNIANMLFDLCRAPSPQFGKSKWLK